MSSAFIFFWSYLWRWQIHIILNTWWATVVRFFTRSPKHRDFSNTSPIWPSRSLKCFKVHSKSFSNNIHSTVIVVWQKTHQKPCFIMLPIDNNWNWTTKMSFFSWLNPLWNLVDWESCRRKEFHPFDECSMTDVHLQTYRRFPRRSRARRDDVGKKFQLGGSTKNTKKDRWKVGNSGTQSSTIQTGFCLFLIALPGNSGCLYAPKIP